MSSRYRRFLAGAFALAFAAPAWAQSTGTIAGRIIDRTTQRPVAGVQVRIVGTARGAQTDEAGAYRIVSVPSGVTQLAAQRIGYGPQARTVNVPSNGIATADFQMTVAATTLDQVLVTATGQSERRRESGVSTASIDSGTVNMANVSTFSDVLSSRAPGVVVQTASGETGSGSRIRIRGSNSISLSNDPLLIVDGIRVDNASQSTAIGTGGQQPSRFNDIPPEDIENIEIIKGPAAAALYGTAAANGVIQVTTKKGRAGKTKWNTFGELGSLKDVNTYPVNYRAFGTLRNTGKTTNCSIYSRASTSPFGCVSVDSVVTNAPLQTTNVLQTGNRKIAGVSAAGGSDVSTYFLSGEYFREQNVIPINMQQRLNLRSNIRGQLTKTLDAQLNVGFINSDLRRPQNDNNALGVVSGALLGAGVDCGPYGLNTAGNNARYPLCGPDTTSRGYFSGQVPQDLFNIDTRQQVQRLTGGLVSNWTPLSWLAVNGTLGADIDQRNDLETLQPNLVFFSQTYVDGYRQIFKAQIWNYTAGLSGTATYDYNPTIRFTTTVAGQYSDIYLNRVDAQGFKLLAGTGSLNGTNARFAVGEQTNDVRTLGFIGREQMAWRDRLFLTAGIRTDRNSAFGVNNPRIYYPSLSASYVISEESYFPKIAALSSLRLRTALGSAGQNPGYLAAEQVYDPVAVVVTGTDQPGFTVRGVGNPSLKPEKSTEFEGGFDLGLFNDRVSAEYTYYNKTTKDALVNVPIAPSVGSSASRFQNLGKVRNSGHEALIRASVVDRDAYKFDFNLSGTWNANKLLDLGVDALGNPITPIIIGSNGTQIHRNGLPLGSYFNRPFTYADVAGTGIIGCPQGRGSATCGVTVADSAAYLGTPFPTNEIAFTPALTIGKSVRVTATVDHRGGQKLFNLTHYFRAAVFTNAQEIAVPTASNLADQAAAVASRLASPYTTFAGYIEDASFTKLREVALTLTLPQEVAARAGAASVNLTLAGRNLHTWTNYSGLDPELNSLNQSNFNTSDFLTAPQVRYFTARLSFAF
jgi:TonB-linked SusC/RagA family outer membrane protein